MIFNGYVFRTEKDFTFTEGNVKSFLLGKSFKWIFLVVMRYNIYYNGKVHKQTVTNEIRESIFILIYRITYSILEMIYYQCMERIHGLKPNGTYVHETGGLYGEKYQCSRRCDGWRLCTG